MNLIKIAAAAAAVAPAAATNLYSSSYIVNIVQDFLFTIYNNSEALGVAVH